MTRRSTRVFHRCAVTAALLAALALAACGRKGPLDAPPGAALAPAQSAASTDAQPQQEQTLFGNAMGRDSSSPVAPQGQKKRIPLDVLLD